MRTIFSCLLLFISLSESLGNNIKTNLETISDYEVVNCTPIARADSLSVCPNVDVTGNLLHNDGNIIDAQSELLSPPSHGGVTVFSNGNFIYTPNQDFCGTDAFIYRVCNSPTIDPNCCDIAVVNISLVDEEAPFILEPIDFTLQCNEDLPPVDLPFSTDNCDPDPFVYLINQTSTKGSDPTECEYYEYEILRIFGAFDNCGNENAVIQSFTIVDTEGPQIIDCPDNITVSGSYPSADVPTFADSCGSEFELDYEEIFEEGCNISITRKWKATDVCGNESICEQLVEYESDLSIDAYISISYNGYHISHVDASDGEITITASGGLAPYEYMFISPNINSQNNNTGIVENVFQSENTFSNLPSGIYDLLIKDALGCTRTQVLQIEKPPFDLALITTLNINSNNTFEYLDSVSYLITIVNQGQIPAKDIKLSFYGHPDLEFIDEYWSNISDDLYEFTVSSTIQIGDVFQIPIHFRLKKSSLDSLVTYAEVSEAKDEFGINLGDIDSTPDALNNNDAGGLANSPADNFLNGDGSGIINSGIASLDEDDHDPVVIYVNNYDVALRTTLSMGFSANTSPGTLTSFDITIFNQGNSSVSEVQIVSYLPVGMTLEDDNWVMIGNIAYFTGHLLLSPGEQVMRSILVRLDPDANGLLSIMSEVAFFKNSDGDFVFDHDSQADTFLGNDLIVDNEIYDNTNDEDDHDIESILVICDDDLPILSGIPEDITIDCDEDVPASPIIGIDILVVGEDPSTVDIVFSETSSFDSDSQSCNHYVYEIIRTWIATDVCENVNTYQQIINIDPISNQSTVISHPITLDLECDSNTNASIQNWLDNIGFASINNGCSQYFWTNDYASFGNLCQGSNKIIVNFLGINVCGDQLQVAGTINVEDNTNPIIFSQPDDIIIPCEGLYYQNTLFIHWLATHGSVLASDACDNELEWSHNFDLNSLVLTNGCSDNTGSFQVVFTATDDCGNSVSAQPATVMFIDNEAPNVSQEPQDIELVCGNQNNQNLIENWLQDGGGLVAIDQCSESFSVSNDFVGLDIDCGNAGTTFVNFMIEDLCGNSTTSVANIIVVDNIPPQISQEAQPLVINCPVSLAFNQIEEWLNNHGNAFASDVCGEVDWSNNYNQNNLDFECNQSNRFNVTFFVADPCNNTSSSTTYIEIVDTLQPIITNPPNNLILECSNPNNTSLIQDWLNVNANAVVIDQCSEVSWINSYSQDSLFNTCSNNDGYEINFTATDACGNSITVEGMIYINDTTSPVLVSSGNDLVLNCNVTDSQGIITTWIDNHGNAVVNDNCGEISWINDYATSENLSCGVDNSIIVTFTASDNCNNNLDYQLRIVFEDTEAPVVETPPNDLLLDCNEPNEASIINQWLANGGGLVAQDNCSTPIITNTYIEGFIEYSCESIEGQQILFTVSDACGNSVTRTAYIRKIDYENPEITEGAENLILSCGQSDIEESISTWLGINGGAVAMDECSSSLEWSNNYEAVLGSNCENNELSVEFLVTDGCGNTNSSTAIVMIIDEEAPIVVTPPMALEIECGFEDNNTLIQSWLMNYAGATFNDNCSQDIEITNDYTAGSLLVGCNNSSLNAVQFMLSDECGNHRVMTSEIIINDNNNPIVSQAEDLILNCDNPQILNLIDDWLENNAFATAMDDCTEELVWENNFSEVIGNCNSEGTEVIFTVFDNCGNFVSTVARIIIQDTETPVIISPSEDLIIECNENLHNNINEWLNANGNSLVEDNCSQVTWENNFADFEFENICNGEPLVVQFTVYDLCGNTASTSSNIIVSDTNAPEFTSFASDVTIECDGMGNVQDFDEWVVNNGSANAVDLCDDDLIWIHHNIGFISGCGATGLYQVNFEVIDDCDNSNVVLGSVNIVDTTDPFITQEPQDLIVECSVESSAEIQNWLQNNGGATGADICGNVSWSYQFENPTSFCSDQSNEVAFYLSDDCGNTVVSYANLIVQDQTPPTVSTGPQELVLNCGYEGDVLQNWLDNAGNAIVEDACTQIISFENNFNTITLECNAISLQEVTFIATDACGNTVSFIGNISLQDNLAPNFQSQVDSIIFLDCNDVLPSINPTAIDNCGGVEISYIEETYLEGSNCSTLENLRRIWTAQDDCGNESQLIQIVEFVDNTAPVFTNIPIDISVSCSDEIPESDITAIDNCTSNVTIDFFQETQELNCPNSYTILRTWAAIDECGNQTSVSQTINIFDNEAPIFTSDPEDIIISCIEETPSEFIFNIQDNCSDEVVITLQSNELEATGDCAFNESIVYVVTASDDCGNSSSREFNLLIIDEEGPYVNNFEPIIQLECSGESLEFVYDWMDDCSGIADVSISDQESGSPCNRTIFRTYIVSDNCGNTSFFNQTINIYDNASPTTELQILPSITVNCINEIPSPQVDELQFVDNCSSSLTFTSTDHEISENGDCPFLLNRMWTISDECDNSIQINQEIIVLDNSSPVLSSFPQDITVDNLNDVQDLPEIFATDCGQTLDVSLVESEQTEDCQGVIFRTWTAEDYCGNQTSHTQKISFGLSTEVEVNINANFYCGPTNIPLSTDLSEGQFTWSSNIGNISNPNSATPTLEANFSGNYIISVLIETPSCIYTGLTQIEVGEAENLSISNNGPVCVGENIILSSNSSSLNTVWTGPNNLIQTGSQIIIENATPSNEGIYNLSATDINGCINTASTSVIVIDNSEITIAEQLNFCEGESIQLGTTASPNLNFSWIGPNNFQSSEANPTITNNAVVGLHNGVYSVTISQGNSCNIVLNTTVDIFRNPVIDADSNDPVCMDQTLELIANENHQVNWTGPNNFSAQTAYVLVDGLSQFGVGLHEFTVESTSEEGCSSIEIITVEILSPILLDIPTSQHFCIGGSFQLFSTSNPSDDFEYLWQGPNNFFSVEANPIVSNSSTIEHQGIYTLIISNIDRCEKVIEINAIGQNQNEFNAEVTNVTCQSLGSINFPSIDPNASYTWQDIADIQDNPNRQNLNVGSYILSIYVNDCEFEYEYIITNDCECEIPAPEDISINPSECSESNGSVTFSQQNYAYNWLIDGFVGHHRENLSTGHYQLEIFDPISPNCLDTIQIFVPSNSMFEVEINTTAVDCNQNNGQIHLDIQPQTGNYQIEWSDSQAENQPLRNNLPPGTYFVTVTDVNGCLFTSSISMLSNIGSAEIQILEFPEIQCQTQCAGIVQFDIANIQTESLPILVSILDSSNNEVENGTLCSGEYCIQVFDSNLCILNQACFNVQESDNINFTLNTTNQICENFGSIELLVDEGDITEYDFEWENFDGNQNFRNNLLEGSYSVIISDTNGCQYPHEITIAHEECESECDEININSINIQNSNCAANDGIIQIDVPESLNYNYSWLPNVSSSNLAESLSAGIYSVTIIDPNETDCSKIIEAVVSDNSSNEIQILNLVHTQCGQSNGSIQFSPTELTYQWLDGFIGHQRENLAQGTYTVSATDNNLCTQVIEFTIDSNTNLQVATQISSPNCNSSDGSIEIDVLNGSGNYLISWQDGNHNFLRENLVVGSYQFTVVDQNNGCSLQDQVILTSANANSSFVEIDDIFLNCPNSDNGTVEYTVSFEEDFSFPEQIIILNEQIEPVTNGELGAGTYQIQLLDSNNCLHDNLSFQVHNPFLFEINHNVQHATCGQGGSIQFEIQSAPGNYEITWSNGLTGSLQNDLLPGIYSVTISDSENCQTVQLNIEILDLCFEGCDDITIENINITQENCADNTASIQVFLQDNPSDYTFNWIGQVYDTHIVSNIPAGNYTLEVISNLNPDCILLVPIIIQIDCETECLQPIISSIQVQHDMCQNAIGQIHIEVGNYDLDNLSFEWSQNTGTTNNQNNIISDLTAGVYSVTIYSDESCHTETTVSILDHQEDQSWIDQVDVFHQSCNQLGRAELFPINLTYMWQDGYLGHNRSNLQAGVYYILITNPQYPNCTEEYQLVIDYNYEFFESYSQPQIADCGQQNGVISIQVANSNNLQFLWSDGWQGQQRDSLAAGLYQVTITDQACEEIINITVQDNCDPVDDNCNFEIEIQQNPCIENGTLGHVEINIGETSEEYSFTWSNGFVGASQSGLSHGDYSITATSQSCNEAFFFHLDQNCDLQNDTCSIIANINQYPCSQNNRLGAVSIFSNPTDAIISWSDGYLGANRTNLLAGYYVIYMQSDNCTDSIIIDLANTCHDPSDCMDYNPFILQNLNLIVNHCDSLYKYCLPDQYTNEDSLMLNGDLFTPTLSCEQSNGNAILLNIGVHQLIMTNNSCVDTINIEVECLFTGEKPTSETIIINVPAGSNDTICFDLSELPGTQYTYTDICNDNNEFFEYQILENQACLQYNSIAIGLDSTCIVICDEIGICDTTTIILNAIQATPNTENQIIEIDQSTIICLDTSQIALPINQIYNICSDQDFGFVDFYIMDNNCINFTGLETGLDSYCFVYCNSAGFCDTTYINIQVENELDNPLLPNASNDQTQTVINTPAEIDFLFNDTINGTLIDFGIIDLPDYGSASIDNQGIIYTPNDFICNVIDQFTYFIENQNGRDTATVQIEILCESILIFSGFSPNHDGINDVLTIVGIEKFPVHKLLVFNRWGNEVYRSTNYQNDWNGVWNNKNLPAGTYFYFFEYGDEEQISGYVHLIR